jgi:hypothetical protein
MRHLVIALILAAACSCPTLAIAECEHLVRPFIGTELGGSRTYLPTLKVYTSLLGPASNQAGVDMFFTPGRVFQGNAHWYKDKIVQVGLTWRPQTPEELSEIMARLVKMTGVARPPELDERAISLKCTGAVTGFFGRSRVVLGEGRPDQPLVQLLLVDRAKQQVMADELKGKDTRTPP